MHIYRKREHTDLNCVLQLCFVPLDFHSHHFTYRLCATRVSYVQREVVTLCLQQHQEGDSMELKGGSPQERPQLSGAFDMMDTEWPKQGSHLELLRNDTL